MKNKNLLMTTLIVVLCISILHPSFGQVLTYQATLQVLGANGKVTSEHDITPAAFSSQRAINGEVFKVFKAQPFSGCTPIKMPKTVDTQQLPYLMLVSGDQGNCGYRKKAVMAQMSLARGVIIIDDGGFQANQSYSNYQQHSLQVFLLNPNNAEWIKNQSQFTVKITYIKVQAKYYTELWTSSMDVFSQETFIFMNNIYKSIPKLQQVMDINFRYAIYSPMDPEYKNDNKSQIQSCGCGSLCSPIVLGGTSDIIIKEDVRRMILIKQNYLNLTKFLEYSLKFRNLCLMTQKQQNYGSECWRNTFKDLNIDLSAAQKQSLLQKVDKKVEQTFTSCSNQYFQQAQSDKVKFHQLQEYPAIFINRQKVIYDSQETLKRAICLRMNLLSEEGCNLRPIEQPGSSWDLLFGILIILITVSVLSAISVFLLVKYRQSLRKEMNKEVKMQVSTAIEHYYTLAENN